MPTLDEEFEAEVRAAVALSRQFNCYPPRFEEVMQRSGAVEAARQFVASKKVHPGLKTLAEHHYLHLSIESIMLKEHYEALFSPSVLEVAEWRLLQV